MKYQEEKVNLEKITKHLDRMKIPYIFQEIGNSMEEKFPAIACTYRHNDMDFDVIVYSVSEWVHVKALVIDTKEYSIDVLAKIYEICLNLNYELPETTFSAFNRKIYVEMDCLSDVDFDDFHEEFGSIADGINHFIDRSKDINQVQLISTKGKSTSEIRGKT